MKYLPAIKIFLAAVIAVINIFIFVDKANADIRFGVTPYLSEEQLKVSFEPILKELSHKLGTKVHLIITRDYSDLAEKMQVGNIDFGAFSPFAYVDAQKKASVSIFATHCVAGRPYYRGEIITCRKNGYSSIDQLSDKTFAFVDPKSASGFLYPRALLIKEGKNPDLFFGKTFFAGSHDKVISAIINKKADAGAVYSDAFEMAKKKYGSDTFRILMETEKIPYDAYVARKGIDPETLEKVKKFFLSLSAKNEPLKSVLKQKNGIRFTGWIKADDSRYDVVRETAAMSRQKKRVAVFNFSASGKLIKVQKLNEVFSEITTAFLAETSRFDIIPGFQLEKILLENNLSFDSPVDEKMSAILKEKLNLDYLLYGKIECKNNLPSIFCYLKNIHRKTPDKKAVFTDDSIEKLSSMSQKCVAWIQQQIPFEAYIIEVNKNEIAIDGGYDMGFKENTPFIIVNLCEKLFDEDNKTIIGRKRRQVAEGVFKSVMKDTAIGRVTGGTLNQVDVGSRVRVMGKAGTGPSVYTLYVKGIKALSDGSNLKAIDLLEQVVKIDPQYTMAHARLSTAYYNVNNKLKGKKHLAIAKLHTDTITFQGKNYILARFATENNETEKAKSLYIDILKKYPNNTSAMHNLGMLYINDKEYNKAESILNKALSIEPELNITQIALRKIHMLRSGKKIDETGTGQVDLVVIFDTTGSMDDEINGMIKETEHFSTTLKNNGIDINFGLISFGDAIKKIYFGNNDKFTLISEVSEFIGKLKKLYANGGGDKPENPFLAFEKAFEYKFRKGARPVFLLITNAPAHKMDKFYWKTVGHIIRKLKKNKITVTIIGPEIDDYKKIADETGGILVSINSNPDFIKKINVIGNTIVHLF